MKTSSMPTMQRCAQLGVLRQLYPSLDDQCARHLLAKLFQHNPDSQEQLALSDVRSLMRRIAFEQSQSLVRFAAVQADWHLRISL